RGRHGARRRATGAPRTGRQGRRRRRPPPRRPRRGGGSRLPGRGPPRRRGSRPAPAHRGRYGPRARRTGGSMGAHPPDRGHLRRRRRPLPWRPCRSAGPHRPGSPGQRRPPLRGPDRDRHPLRLRRRTEPAGHRRRPRRRRRDHHPRSRSGQHGPAGRGGGRTPAHLLPRAQRGQRDRDGSAMNSIGSGGMERPDPAAASRAPDGPVVRTVVVDDHPVVRDGLVAMLGSEPDITVVGIAEDGREALAVITATDPDVVLMDLRMPGGGGAESIRALRERDRTKPRILVLTTYDTDRDIRSALEAGADGFLLKDTRRDDVIRAVHDLAGGRAVLAPAALAALTGADPRAELSRREVEVLRLVADGCTNRAVATRLAIGEASVRTHLVHGYEKVGVGDRGSAVRNAWELGVC